MRAALEAATSCAALDADNVAAKEIKAKALTELGERQVTAPARNCYLTSAQFLMKHRN